eukprot:768783-Hanusia_phi.AAC.8
MPSPLDCELEVQNSETELSTLTTSAERGFSYSSEDSEDFCRRPCPAERSQPSWSEETDLAEGAFELRSQDL